MDDVALHLAALRRRAQRVRERRQAADRAAKPLDGLTPKQLEAIGHPSRFKSWLVGRRGGKTTGVRGELAHILNTETDTDSIFVAQTAETARELCWVPLERAAERNGWPLRFDGSKYVITGPHGARLKIAGSETLRDLEKKRGPGYRHIRVDECGAIRPSYLKYMVEDVFEPMMMDNSASDIVLTGTPGPTCVGYWHDITTGALPGFKTFRWTYKDNPHVDQSFVDELLKRRGWDRNHPTFVREYLAEWKADPSRLVFRFDRERNLATTLPQLHARDEWVYIMGLDFGYGDACAWAVLAYPLRWGKNAYVVCAGKEHGLVPSDFVPIIKALVDHFRPEKIVGDVNGLGKAYAMEFMKRHPDIPIIPAQKVEKRAALEFTSDALATGALMSLEGYALEVTIDGKLRKLGQNDGLHAQWSSLVWDEERKDIAEGQDDDIADAVLYPFRETPAYDNVSGPPKREDLPRHVREDMGLIEPEDSSYLEVPDL